MKIILLSFLFLMLSISSCASSDKANYTKESSMKTLQGTVSYRERMMLPKEAVIRVVLEDISLADAPSRQIAQTSFNTLASVPFAFNLAYDENLIQDRHRYTLRATISLNEKLMFTSTSYIDPFKEPLHILVKSQTR